MNWGHAVERVRQIFNGSRCGKHYAITVLIPIRQGAEADLVRHLGTLSRVNSPLAQLPTVHFGRWLVIDKLKAHSSPDRIPLPTLKSQYLLFTAAASSDTKAFLRELVARIPDVVDDIWGHCFGYPGGAATNPAAVEKYLSRGVIKTSVSLFFAGYPDATPAEVRTALAGHTRFISFVRDNQHNQDPEILQKAYRVGAPTWFR